MTQRSILFFIIILAGVAVNYIFYITPLQKEISGFESTISSQRAKLSIIETKLSGPEAQKIVSEYADIEKTLSELLSEKETTVQSIGDLDREIAATELEILSLTSENDALTKVTLPPLP